MKRKVKKKPVWQTIPMNDVYVLIQGWEVTRQLQEKIKNDAAALRELSEILSAESVEDKIMQKKLEQIVPCANQRAAAWMTSTLHPRIHMPDDEGQKAAFVIIMLWETLKAVERLGGSALKESWLSGRSFEEQLFFNRLERRVTQLVK